MGAMRWLGQGDRFKAMIEVVPELQNVMSRRDYLLHG
jgi:hypothetical protein